MSESNYIPDGTGNVMGDTRAMPNRGTKTGMTGMNTVTDGRSLDVDATNTMGGMSGTDSNPSEQRHTRDDNGGY